MKKYIICTSFILLATFTGCNSQIKNDSNVNKTKENVEKQAIEKVELTRNTRGTNIRITYTPTTIIQEHNGETSNSAISSTQWNDIVAQAKLLDLKNIGEYKSPSTLRYSDRAMAATIRITSGGTVYTSGSFDDGRPPAELESFYIKLTNSSLKTKTK